MTWLVWYGCVAALMKLNLIKFQILFLKYFLNKYFMNNTVVFVTFYLALVNNYAHLQIFYMTSVKGIRAILHNHCALRFLRVLWCALGTKGLGTTGLGV